MVLYLSNQIFVYIYLRYVLLSKLQANLEIQIVCLLLILSNSLFNVLHVQYILDNLRESPEGSKLATGLVIE